MYLLQNGFTPNLVDTNVYVKRVGTLFVAITLYIHDCIIVTNDHKKLPQTKSLINVEFDMSKMRELEILFWYSH
jgi:hypothetical protein